MSNTRLDSLRMVDPVLTTIAQGYTNNAFIAHKLFPTVDVNKMKGKIPVFSKNSFVMRDTERALRAASNRIPPEEIVLMDFETHERDVEIALDYLEEEESSEFFRYEQRSTKELLDILLTGREKAAADLVQNPANYDDDMKLVISSEADSIYAPTSNADTETWVNIAKDAIRSKIGKYPNVMIMGDVTLRKILNHNSMTNKIRYTNNFTVNAELVKEVYNIENIIVGTSVYSPDGVSMEDIWGDNIIFAYVDQSPRRSEYNPSFGYTFRRKGMPEVDTYYENGGKVKVIRATDNYSVQVTGKDAGFLIANTNFHA